MPKEKRITSARPPRLPKTGRPPVFTMEIQDRIVKAILIGAYVETAAISAGITKETLYTWMKDGIKRPDSPYRGFSDAVNKAIADAELHDIATIEKASVRNWQAAAWKLERRNWQRWGRKDKQELSGPNGGPIQLARVDVPPPPADLEAWLEQKQRQMEAGKAVLVGSNGHTNGHVSEDGE